ncbi:MAG: MFS transporter [Armatimonadetes bacterium]|nr:MFS transporter [Armatimonadota bacterium]
MTSASVNDLKSELTARSRSIVIAIALVAGFAELAYAMMNVSAMPVYLKFSMGYGEASVTAIGASFLLCEGLMKGPFGVIGDRIGRKKLIMAGPLVSVVTALLTLWVQPHQWYFFVALRVLDGLGAAALWPAALAMMADVVSDDRRSHAMSLFNVTYLVGIALGPALGGAANDLTAVVTQRLPQFVASHSPEAVAKHVHATVIDPRQASFYLISVLFMATAIAAWWRIPQVPPHHKREGAATDEGFSWAVLVATLRQSPQMLLMAFTVFFGVGQIMFLVKLFAMAEYGMSESMFGSLLLVPCLIIALASLPLGSIGDKLGKVRAVRIGIGLCAFSMWALILVPGHAGVVIGGSLIGAGFVVAFPSWMAHISENCVPSQRGAVMGAVGTAQGAGALLGVPIGGFLYERATISIPWLPWLNGHYAPFIACALLLLVGWVLALTTIRDTRPTGAAPASAT